MYSINHCLQQTMKTQTKTQVVKVQELGIAKIFQFKVENTGTSVFEKKKPRKKRVPKGINKPKKSRSSRTLKPVHNKIAERVPEANPAAKFPRHPLLGLLNPENQDAKVNVAIPLLWCLGKQ